MKSFDSSLCIGFTCGAFDFLHSGHLAMLQECKKNCEYLIVGLHIDPSKENNQKNSPVQAVMERYYQLRSNNCVDEIIPYETEQDLRNILSIFPINIRFVGFEYENEDIVITGTEIMKERSIYVFYNEKRLHNFSSSLIRQKVINHGRY